MRVYKRGKSWTYDVQWTDSGGKAQRNRKGGFKSKREAQEAGTEVEYKVKKGIINQKPDKTLYEFFENYIELYKVDVAESTKDKYYDTLKSIDKIFPFDTIKKMTTADYQAGLNKYAETHALATTKKFHTQIRAAVSRAFDDGDIERDFTKRAIVSGNRAAKKDSEKYISETDLDKLLEYVESKIDPRYPNPYVIYTAATTGMRYGEILGLTWADIDFDNKKVDINKAWDYKRKHDFTNNKNMFSPRIIAISDDLIDILKTYREQQKDLLKEQNKTNDKDLVFLSPISGMPTNDGSNDRLKEYLEKLSITPIISMHGLRHTHASVLFRHGISVLAISKRLGHKNTSVTYSTYLHIIKELENEDQDKIFEVINRKKGTS